MGFKKYGQQERKAATPLRQQKAEVPAPNPDQKAQKNPEPRSRNEEKR